MQVFRKTENIIDSQITKEISDKFDLPLKLSQMLYSRGIDSLNKAAEFLKPSDELFHDPFLFADMQDAVDCIFASGEMGSKICIYGDYDCDGISGVAILYRFLKSLDYDVIPYIPQRHDEGYGLNINAIDELYAMGVELIVTVDCGITAVSEIEHAYNIGMEVVLTDHHQCPEILPECEAIINPSRNDGYPFEMLCGAGVAFKIVQAMAGLDEALNYIDIAAIATVADIVNLVDENRLIVIRGLEKINSGQCIDGIKALVEVAGFEIGKLAADNISYGLAPRINAMGRVGSAMDSLLLFLSDDHEESLKLSRKLDSENSNRQEIERGIVLEIDKMIASRELDISRAPAILIESETWNSGIIGIVCSKLTYKYNKPVIIFTGSGDTYTASGRSIKGINLYEELAPFADMFERFGGHEMAAGITIKKSKYADFKSRFIKQMRENINPDAYLPLYYYDLELSAQEINKNTVNQIERISPFGIGNTAPNILIKESEVDSIRRVGADKNHLQFKVGDVGFISFGTGDDIDILRRGNAQIICNLEKNFFAGVDRLQGKVVAFKEEFPKNIDNYMDERKYLFTSAFLRRILYNSSSLDNKIKTEDLIEYSADIQEIILDKFSSSIFGSIILSQNINSAKKLLEFINKSKLNDKIDLAFGGLENANAYNAVLLAPNISKIDLTRYDNIFVDGIFDKTLLSALQNSGAKVIIDSNADTSWLKDISYTRDELIPVYKLMINLALTNDSFTSKSEYVCQIQNLADVDRNLVEYALKVFDDLEFIKVIDSMPFVVKVNNKPSAKDLLESDWHSKAVSAFEMYGDWKKKSEFDS